MSIDEMIQMAIKTKDFNAATYLTDIKKFALDNNITINQAITHISTLNPRPYYRNLLNMLSRYYPKTNKTDAKENILNEYAFYGTGIHDLNITPCMESISASCFACCDNLVSVDLPKNIIRIGNQAFNSCNGLTAVSLHRELQSIGARAFASCDNLVLVNIDFDSTQCVTYEHIFAYCAKLHDVAFGEKFTTIPESMFTGSGLTELELPQTISKIQKQAFMDCSKLRCVETAAQFIGNQTFLNCPNLEKVRLTNKTLNVSEETPGSHIFDRCPKLNSAGPLGEDVDIEFAWDTVIPDYALSRGWYTGLTGGFTSSYTNSLTSVSLPSTLKVIGAQAFKNSLFSNIRIPVGLTTIKEAAFDGCVLLSALDIPTTVNSIGAGAFSYCTALRNEAVKIRAKTSNFKVETPQNAWFFGCNSDLKLLVPGAIVANIETTNQDLLNAYGTYWNHYSSTGKLAWEGRVELNTDGEV
jgi:hypothetical protein